MEDCTKEKLKWIPWQRYLVLIAVDGKKTVGMDRFRLARSAINEAARMKSYKGLVPHVFDTKEKTVALVSVDMEKVFWIGLLQPFDESTIRPFNQT
jgi:hypothetical protein